jgi:Mannosyltransferase (PIG-V)
MTMRRARAFWGELGGGWQLALWLLATLRISLGLVAVLSLHLNAPAGAEGDWSELLIRGGEPWSELLSTWQRWDALWYQRIAEAGYRPGDGTAHFQPLYPLLARIVSVPLSGQVVWAELLVSSAAFALAMWLLYRVARFDVGPLVARLSVLLTALFPTGFFLLAPYTEALYLTLTVAALYLARSWRTPVCHPRRPSRLRWRPRARRLPGPHRRRLPPSRRIRPPGPRRTRPPGVRLRPRAQPRPPAPPRRAPRRGPRARPSRRARPRRPGPRAGRPA